ARGPVVRESNAAAADRVEAHAPRVRGPDLEARRVDDAVDLVLDAVRDHTRLGDALDALPVGVDELGRRQVERLEVLVVKAGALTELAIPRLELLRGRRVADDRVDAHADLLHLLEVGVLERAQHAFG